MIKIRYVLCSLQTQLSAPSPEVDWISNICHFFGFCSMFFFCFCLFFIFYRIHLFYQIAIAMHLPVLVISYSFIHIIEYSYLIHWLNKTEEEHNFLWAIFPIFIVIIAISKELCMVEFYSLFLKESEQILPFKCLIGFWCRLMFMYYTY